MYLNKRKRQREERIETRIKLVSAVVSDRLGSITITTLYIWRTCRLPIAIAQIWPGQKVNMSSIWTWPAFWHSRILEWRILFSKILLYAFINFAVSIYYKWRIDVTCQPIVWSLCQVSYVICSFVLKTFLITKSLFRIILTTR